MPDTAGVVHALYSGFFERGVRYFFPDASLGVAGRPPEFNPELAIRRLTDSAVDLEWMGTRYRLEHPAIAFTEDQMRLLGAIGTVLHARYRSIFNAAPEAFTSSLFEGLPEDRYVSAFLDHSPSLDAEAPAGERDVVADAIALLRESSLLTYENRRISTGVVLLAAKLPALDQVRYRGNPQVPRGALPYNSSLTGIKSFHRLCDGMRTVFLVDRHGMLLDLVDLRAFSGTSAGLLPAPSAFRYRPHCLATLHGGHLCLVLTPNGEIKVFARGAQLFNFMEGRWRLTDAAVKYREFRLAVGHMELAERLFTAGLNLSEHRRGGLFVVLNDAATGRELVAPQDLLENEAPAGSQKGQVHYLLRGKSVLEIELSVLQSIARVDGGIVIARDGRLLAFGAILRNGGEFLAAEEGGRTTAAVHASRFGQVLKISEDGEMSFYRGGTRVWEI
jgi:DisA bacterial checkpoint controller nucleotide-binding